MLPAEGDIRSRDSEAMGAPDVVLSRSGETSRAA